MVPPGCVTPLTRPTSLFPSPPRPWSLGASRAFVLYVVWTDLAFLDTLKSCISSGIQLDYTTKDYFSFERLVKPFNTQPCTTSGKGCVGIQGNITGRWTLSIHVSCKGLISTKTMGWITFFFPQQLCCVLLGVGLLHSTGTVQCIRLHVWSP